MSTYKKLNKQDAYITTYAAHKYWAVTGSDFVSYGITGATAGSGYILENLQQLYYRNKSTDGDGTIPSHSFDLYNQTSLFYSSSRVLTTGSRVISIPRQMYGTAIKPGTFKLSFTDAQISIGLVLKGYVADGYVQETPTVYLNKADGTTEALVPPGGGTSPTINNTPYTFIDDAEGNLLLSGSNVGLKVGDIIYTHGMAIVTNPSYWPMLTGILTTTAGLSTVTMSFQNTQPIFTHNYHCKIRESEYNFTYNPSALSSSIKTTYDNDGYLYSTSSDVNDGVIRNNLTGSVFQPYITTIGLYNDANELIAVGKTGQPIPKSANTEMTIIVKIDI
jgi:hypothetical protein